ncbi:hypothetical protein GF377_02665 [candidate division GN15 bacterium]|nr:hypothetical protein [candidate division GN15 bacterium]
MAKFQVVMTPGVVKDTATPIVVRFTSPKNATGVVVTAVEMDSWSSIGDTLSEAAVVGSDELAEFKGKLVNSKFELAEKKIGKGGKDDPVIKLKFHGGGDAIDIPVPNAAYSDEAAELEIGVKIEGKIGAHKKKYVTPRPVFVRHPRMSGTENRPIITFITGSDDYHKAAKKYWQPRVDGIKQLGTLQEILAYISDKDKLPGDKKWGQINIVSHGNEWEWFLRVLKGGPKRTTASLLKKNRGNNALVQPGDDVVDGDTTVVLRGCSLGHNQDLLDEVRHFFGGKAKVYSPKYIQWYRYKGKDRRELFVEYFYYYHPGTTTPGKADIYKALRKKYQASTISDKELKALVDDVKARKLSNDRTSFELTYQGGDPPSKTEDRMAALEAAWSPEEWNHFTGVDDWKWQISVKTAGKDKVLVFKGTRQRVEYRRDYKDKNDNHVVPDITDNTHYGRSPAW